MRGRGPIRARRSLAALAVVAVAASAGCGGSDGEARDDGTRPSTALEAPTTTAVATAAPTTTPPTTAAPTTTAPPTTVPPTTAPPTSLAPSAVAHVFPLRPASAGSYARSHHDYPAADIFAPCGTDAVAISDGTVQDVTTVDVWSSKNDLGEHRGGLSVSVVGDDGVRSYGSHLREIDPAVAPGVRVVAGQRLGAVGDTGNAKGAGCHLHFGLSAPCGPGDWQVRRGQIWPQPYLDAWQDGGDRSPVAEVRAAGCGG